MGLIHSRARKKRNKAEARVLNDQHEAHVAARRAADLAAKPWYLQPTLGAALQSLARPRD